MPASRATDVEDRPHATARLWPQRGWLAAWLVADAGCVPAVTRRAPCRSGSSKARSCSCAGGCSPGHNWCNPRSRHPSPGRAGRAAAQPPRRHWFGPGRGNAGWPGPRRAAVKATHGSADHARAPGPSAGRWLVRGALVRQARCVSWPDRAGSPLQKQHDWRAYLEGSARLSDALERDLKARHGMSLAESELLLDPAVQRQARTWATTLHRATPAPGHPAPGHPAPRREEAPTRTLAYQDEGSGKTHQVEVAGIEPASFSTSPGLLRVQPAVLLSAPAVTQASHRRAQPLFGVLGSPAARPPSGASLLMPVTGPEALPG